MDQKHKVKITVIRKECFADLQQIYLADPNSGPCPLFEVGQEFILERDGARDDFWHMMSGKFCSEAWEAGCGSEIYMQKNWEHETHETARKARKPGEKLP